ncbi:MAG: hypothetical protein PHX52_02565 [Candidatus Pacebacteria bacterium]|nr:hypothetical protein [Candidatus Paceibacterota bacterium]
MENLQKNIIGITIGIRFSRSFRIPDISGDIIDNILYGEKTPFGPKFFPEVQENSDREKTLFNSKTSEYLRINTDDLILGIKIDNNFDDKFEWIKNDVLEYFKEILFKEYKIKNIVRIGIIFYHKIVKNNKMNETILSITEGKIEDADNISLSFSKKLPAKEALYRKGVDDYKNTIYNLQEKKEYINSSLDYQYYYKPAIEDLRDCFVDNVFDDAKGFLINNYYSWIIKNENKQK